MDSAATTGILPPGLEDAELIAQGGFAIVYRAWQPDFHRRVAVKVLVADASDPAVRARFEREVRAMGSVSDHPNVVPVYDAGVAGDRPYLVMPYMAGGSLADDMAPMAVVDVVRIGVAVADALDAAHRAGLLHRDVKPANILRTQTGEPKLADFGVARFSDATATQGQLAMTLAYAAPELLQGEAATVASDVYSLGATLHALLRGDQPFPVPEDGGPMAMAVRIIGDEAPDLRASGVPAGVAAVIERAMAKRPGDRYPSAAALRQALQGIAGDGRGATTAMAAAPTAGVTTVVPATAVQPALIDLRDDVPTPAPAPAPRRPPVAAAAPATGRAWWPFLLGALVVLGVIAAALVAAGDDDDTPAATPTPTTVAATGAAAPTTVTTAAPPETTEAPPATTVTTASTATTEAPSAPAPAPSGDAVDAARSYFAALDAGDIDEGWSRLSPRYQEQSGRSSYYGFWETIAAVEVLDAEPGADEQTAVVRLRYTRDDGTTSTETNTLRFVEGDDGTLLVDGSS